MTKVVRFFDLLESPGVFACEVIIDGHVLNVSVWPETVNEFLQKANLRFEPTGNFDGDWREIALVKPAKA
jgi:hypothetical protein